MMIAHVTSYLCPNNQHQVNSDRQLATDKQKQTIVKLKSINKNDKASIGD